MNGGSISINLLKTSGMILISDCIFNSTSSDLGGALYLHTSELKKNSFFKITNTHFYKTSSKFGGSLYFELQIWNDFLIYFIKNCTFQKNYAIYNGGAIYIFQNSNNIEQNIERTEETNSVFLRDAFYNLNNFHFFSFQSFDFNVSGNIFDNCSSLLGGGGALFIDFDSISSVQNQGLISFNENTFERNQAIYGNNMASNPYFIYSECHKNDSTKLIFEGSYFNLSFYLLDFYENVVKFPNSSISIPSVKLELLNHKNAILVNLNEKNQFSNEGFVQFTDLQILGEKSKKYQLTAMLDSPNVGELSVNSSIELAIVGCPIGYINLGQQCISCNKHQYSFDGNICIDCPLQNAQLVECVKSNYVNSISNNSYSVSNGYWILEKDHQPSILFQCIVEENCLRFTCKIEKSNYTENSTITCHNETGFLNFEKGYGFGKKKKFFFFFFFQIFLFFTKKKVFVLRVIKALCVLNVYLVTTEV